MIKLKTKRALLLMLMSVMTVINARSETTADIDGLRYSLNGAYATVSRVLSSNRSEKIIVPATITYQGLQYTVNHIGNKAFSSAYASYTKEVELPETIEGISEYAFNNSNITKVKLNEGLKELGAHAFENSSITELIIPSTVKTFNTYNSVPYTFSGCNLLRTLIYLGTTAPKFWTATSFTYVPTMGSYSSPSHSINNASVIEMISFSESVFTYSGNAPSPTWTNNVEGYSAELEMPTLHSEVGSYEVTIPVTFTKGEVSFTTNIAYTYTIEPVKLKAKAVNMSRAYGEPNPDFTVSYSGFINSDDENVLTTPPAVSTKANVKSAVGTYPLTVSGGEAKNYTLEYESGELTINKASLNIQVMDATRIYGNDNSTFTIGYSGLKNGETAPEWIEKPTFTTKATKESDAGIYEVSVACEPKNYTIVTNTPGKLTIEKATLNVKANNATMDYGGPMPTYNYTYSGFVNGDDERAIATKPSIATEATVKSDAGTYAITPEGAQAKNYDFSYTAGTLTINKRILKVKAINTSRTYGESNPDFTVSYSGFINSDNENVLTTPPVVSTKANVKSAVGTYPITISGGEAKNYTLEYEPGELTINKASLNIQVMDATRIYGNDNSTFTIGYSGLKNGETAPEWIEKPTFTTKATKESDAGIYEVSVACEPKNYTIATNTPGKLTIEKATLNVKANNATMDYGGPMPTYSYTYSGFVNGDDESAIATKPSIATEATVKSSFGTYTITPEGAQAKNYDFSYTAGTLTINKRILKVKANSASRVYGEENPAFTVEYDGFVNNETKDALEVEPIASTTATAQSKTGTYDIVVSGGRSANYAMTYQNGQLTITPRPLKAFVGNYERPYGEDNPRFELQYDGFAGNDTESSFTNLPIARTSATRTSNVGTYEIQVTGGYSPNYTLSYGKGTLTITKAEQNFTWEQDLTSLKVGDQVELQAYTSSKLPISFTTDADDYAEIYKAGTKTYMECKKAGSFHIKAVQEGNDNYYPTQRINKNVTIIDDEDNKPTLNIKQAENGMISTKVSKGGTYTFTILAESGWKIHSVTFNETDVTGDLNPDNTYTTPKITENSTLTIIYEQDGSTVDAVKSSKVNIHATNRGICVNGVDVDDTIQVFTLDGILQQSVRATESQVEIPLQKDQVYVVKAGGKTVKLRL